MSPVFAARRRAEEFAALVEHPSTAGPHDARLDDLLQLVGALRTTPVVTPRPEFVAGLRERLMTAAETTLVPGVTERLTLPPRRTSRDRRIAAAVGGLALVGATTSMAMAAQSALPGDALYPVKRAIENAQTEVSFGEGPKGEALLANAAGRLDEVSALSREGDLEDAPAIADTLDAFTDQATQASDLLLADYAQHGHEGSITELRDFTAASLDQLATLESLVPEEARDELVRAGQVLVRIDGEAQQACPSCGGTGISEIPPLFAPVSMGLGSVPTGQATGAPETPGQQTIHDPSVPDVDGDTLPPGSVLPGDTGDGNGPSAGTGGSEEPLTSLTDEILGGTAPAPTSNPSLPGDGVLLDGLDGVDGTVDDLTDPLVP